MDFNRRAVLATSTGLAFALGATSVAARPTQAAAVDDGSALKLRSGSARDQAAVLQDAIDVAYAAGRPVLLPAGRFVVGGLELRDGTRLIGAHGTTALVGANAESIISARNVSNIVIEGIRLEGSGQVQHVVSLEDCQNIRLENLEIQGASGSALRVRACAGRIEGCMISEIGAVGIFALDSAGLEITRNTIAHCGNNGIQVWRSHAGDDSTMVSGNRISHVTARDGGDGPNGNGINVFRANNVTVANNKISDCAFSAVRGNAASNIQIVGNTCQRLGEVALYAEFGFEGAVISQNLVDTAATGIAVTNFNEGGRLAVVQGNLVRNLFRREHEPVDKRGEGITVEADATVTGNTIEEAATAGLAIGWGAYMRNVSATGNVIREASVGIMISADKDAGACLVSGNMISGSRNGAIRAMDHGRVIGPDLSTTTTQTGRVSIFGNLAV
ncbi:Nitrous oxidase accessory protein [Candidatus Filomicrobium marinum]|uniref:Nitrous oxidase accessory protein n=2 Tax=Filomicrobium TaxID=119044 RepID=A0A0D6JG37_9HYPH|nr:MULTISPECIES: TIGR03808 family TAT-translocated repetitive protein [Filomicrobium]CFX53327.1 Nitrous oxidase accessory protein [Candidatus Filomicrobium marinum]CPR19941.1 Nitrous oxidase accessory protein [Candidatus Filomicrobium marinum]SDP07539.1 twin-arg-translocated uncharacterized repeat-containing protein [Filomicrobium insigne]